MDGALDRLIGEMYTLAPGLGTSVRLHSGGGRELSGTLAPPLADAAAEAARSGRTQPAVFRDENGQERELLIFPAPGLDGYAVAFDAGVEQRLLGPAIENLVNQIAHDVRNYAFTVGLQAEMGSRRAGVTSELRAHFDAVLRQVDSLKHYLEQLLVFGRAPSLAPSELDPVLLVRELVNRYQFSRPADAAPLSVRIDAEPHPGKVRWDGRAISAALLALLDNAVRSADSPPPITVRMARRGELVSVEVRDGGGGIAPDVLARLAVPMAVRRAGGAGLGLAIARKLAAAHGGRLLLDSTPSGTVVTLELPAEAGAV